MFEKLVHLVFAAILTLAVPLQGALAAGAGQCHHEHGAGKVADEHSLQVGSGGELAATLDDSSAADSHCDPCVACCASVSIAGWAGPIAWAEPHPGVTVPPVPLLPTPLSSRMDRPPLDR